MLAARWILKGKAPCERGEAFFGNEPTSSCSVDRGQDVGRDPGRLPGATGMLLICTAEIAAFTNPWEESGLHGEG